LIIKKINKGGGHLPSTFNEVKITVTGQKSRKLVRKQTNKQARYFYEGRLYKNINACLTNKIVIKAKRLKKRKKLNEKRPGAALSLAKKAKKKSHNLKYPRVPLVFPSGSERKIWQ